MDVVVASVGPFLTATLVVLGAIWIAAFLIQIVVTPRRMELRSAEMAEEQLRAVRRDRDLASRERDLAREELARYATPRFRLTPRATPRLGAAPASASLWIENIGQTEARNCRGRLIGVTTVTGVRQANLDVPLSWAHPDLPTDLSRKTFFHGAELEVAVHGSANHMVPAAVSRRDVFDPRTVQLARDTDLILGIEIAPEGDSATVGWFRLKWWSSVTIRNTDDDSITVYDLPGDEVEFEEADLQSSSAAISSQVHT